MGCYHVMNNNVAKGLLLWKNHVSRTKKSRRPISHAKSEWDGIKKLFLLKEIYWTTFELERNFTLLFISSFFSSTQLSRVKKLIIRENSSKNQLRNFNWKSNRISPILNLFTSLEALAINSSAFPFHFLL